MIIVKTSVSAPLTKVWEYWTLPEHITQWNFASDEWCCPAATNELKPGGSFVWRMEAKDGSMGFDFAGTYVEIEEGKRIAYQIADGRRVEIDFSEDGEMVKIREAFEAEGMHTKEQQRAGWQAILENFKQYAESAVKVSTSS